MNAYEQQFQHAVRQIVHWAYGLPPLVLVAGAIALTLATFWAHWRIVQRAGYPGCWSLMLLIPCVNLIFLAGFAFSKWPVEKRGR